MPRNKSSQRRRTVPGKNDSGVATRRKEIDISKFNPPNTKSKGKRTKRIILDPGKLHGAQVRVRPGETLEKALRRFKRKTWKKH